MDLLFCFFALQKSLFFISNANPLLDYASMAEKLEYKQLPLK